MVQPKQTGSEEQGCMLQVLFGIVRRKRQLETHFANWGSDSIANVQSGRHLGLDWQSDVRQSHSQRSHGRTARFSGAPHVHPSVFCAETSFAWLGSFHVRISLAIGAFGPSR